MKIPGLDELLAKLDYIDQMQESLNEINQTLNAMMLIQAEALRQQVIDSGGTLSPRVNYWMDVLDQADESIKKGSG